MIDIPPPAMIEARNVAEDRRVLDTIHWLENPRDVRTPGKAGELGPYQFTRSTWEHLTHLPFTPEFACDRDIAFAVAILHLTEIRLTLRRAGVPEQPLYLAACWNAGTTRVLSGTIPESTKDYVSRFNNLYYHGQKKIENKWK